MNVLSFVAAKFLASLFICALTPLIFVGMYNLTLRVAVVTFMKPPRAPSPHDINFEATPVWRGA